jgi:hypothetical protein
MLPPMKEFDRLATLLVKHNQSYLIELLEFAECDIDSRLREKRRKVKARPSAEDWDFAREAHVGFGELVH